MVLLLGKLLLDFESLLLLEAVAIAGFVVGRLPLFFCHLEKKNINLEKILIKGIKYRASPT